MNIVNEHDVIVEFSSLEDIMSNYCSLRLTCYERRKASLVKDLQHQYDKSTWLYKYIDMVANDRLIVKKRPKNEVKEDLKERGFPPYSLNKSVTEEYSYYLHQPLYKLTLEELDKLRQKQEKIRAELSILKDTSETTMWLNELGELRQALLATNRYQPRDTLGTYVHKNQRTSKTPSVDVYNGARTTVKATSVL
jgi:DNA topoisomerase-2